MVKVTIIRANGKKQYRQYEPEMLKTLINGLVRMGFEFSTTKTGQNIASKPGHFNEYRWYS